MPTQEPVVPATGPALPAAGLVPDPGPPPAAESRAGWVLALGSLSVFVVFLDTTVVNVAFETISRSFGTTAGHLSWALNSYSLVFAAVLIPAGRLADRYGRKRLFLTGLGGFALFSALCGVTPDAGVLIAARGLQGAFAALIVPSSLALVLPEFPAARRHVAIGTWSAMGAAAAVFGPTMGALLTEYVSWRWIFLINVPICLLVIVAGVRLLRESREAGAAGIPDPLGTVLVAAVPGLLSFAIIEGPAWGWGSPWVVARFAASAVLVPVFLWRTATAARPVLDLSLFKVRQFNLVNTAALLFGTAFYGLLLSNTIFLQSVWHYSVLRAALGAAPAPLVVVLIARSASKLAVRVGHRPVLLAGALSWAAGAILFALLISGSPDWPGRWLPISLLTGVGIGLTLPVQSGAAVATLPPERLALGSSVASSFRQIGAVLGVSLFVAILGTSAGGAALDAFHHTWLVFAGLSLASGAVLFLPSLRRPRPAAARDNAAGVAAPTAPGGR